MLFVPRPHFFNKIAWTWARNNKYVTHYVMGSKRVGLCLYCAYSIGKPYVSHTYHVQRNKIRSSHDARTHANFEFLIRVQRKLTLIQ